MKGNTTKMPKKDLTIPLENLIVIEKISNGFVVRTWSWEDDNETTGEKIHNQEAVGITDESDDEKKVLSDLLYTIAEFTGYHYDKYGKENLKISFDKKGHKLGDED